MKVVGSYDVYFFGYISKDLFVFIEFNNMFLLFIIDDKFYDIIVYYCEVK